MNAQIVAVLLVVGVAVLYLVRAAWRTLTGKGSGCGGCRCSAKPAPKANAAEGTLIPADQLTLRRRDDRPA